MTNIINITPGNYTPGAQSSLDAMAAVINAAWSLGNDKYSAFEAKVDAITNNATGWLGTQATPTVTAGTVSVPTITEPAVDIPATQSAGDALAVFDTKYMELVALLSDKFTAFRTEFFPTEKTTYAAAEKWLSDALDNPSNGLPVAVANQLLEEDRSRILADASRASDAVISKFAALRFPLPPGAAAEAVLQIQQGAQSEISASSRKLMIASIEQMRFVIQNALNLRQSAMDAAIKYISALASGPDLASKAVSIGYDAQSKLISAASQFYNARTAAAETVAKISEFNVSTALDAASKNQAANLTMIEDKLKALLTECQALAQMITSLFNNVHASAGTSYSVNGS